MKIQVQKITIKDLLDEACSFTAGKHVEINDLEAMYKAEHSPIRTQIFIIRMFNIPSYVSTHFVRHNVGVSRFVKSNRNSDSVITRDTPVDHMMMINAQALISMARRRLCRKSDPATVEVMEAIKREMVVEDKALANCLVPDCEYRGQCCELKSCGKEANVGSVDKCLKEIVSVLGRPGKEMK